MERPIYRWELVCVRSRRRVRIRLRDLRRQVQARKSSSVH